MAGFKQPVYEILSFNQSFSVYDRNYELFETKYHSPIADDATYDYNYKLLDTVAIDGRLSYMIYFKKKRSAKLQVLKEFYTLIKAIMLLQKLLCVSKVF
jgi:hypothetical protein